MDLVIASRNKGKVSEIRALLRGLPITVRSIDDYSGIPEIKETGQTFEENAAIKAQSIFKTTKTAVLADDSGLEIDALGGKPGIYSNRFGGEGLSDVEKCRLILSLMENIPEDKRSARFRTAVCIIDRNGNSYFTEGVCEGVITHEPVGDNGFGYDPIFHLPDIGKTMAQLSQEEKNAISHRGRALRDAVEVLKGILEAECNECGTSGNN